MAHSKEYTKIMNSQRWQNLRNETLKARPYCERCQAKGRLEKAQIVHHIKPIESGHSNEEYESLAFNPENLQPLCNKCHSYIHRIEIGSLSKAGRMMRDQDRHQRWINDIRKRFTTN